MVRMSSSSRWIAIGVASSRRRVAPYHGGRRGCPRVDVGSAEGRASLVLTNGNHSHYRYGPPVTPSRKGEVDGSKAVRQGARDPLPNRPRPRPHRVLRGGGRIGWWQAQRGGGRELLG